MILKNKTALITGASGMIGKTIAEFFSKEGCRLLLSGRSVAALENIKKELASSSGGVTIYPSDVSDIESVKKLMEFARENFSSLDVLVTAAGIYGEIGTLEQGDPQKWLDAVKVNLFGTALCIKYALPLLKKSARAKIITFAGGGDGPLPNFTSYASSKGAIIRLTESLSQELAVFNIDINAISPGPVNSGLVQDLIKAGEERVGKKKYEEALRQVTGQNKVESPVKAASLAVFLASDQSQGLTGRNISAVWDNWQAIPQHLQEIQQSDIYTWRRVKPKDRGYEI